MKTLSLIIFGTFLFSILATLNLDIRSENDFKNQSVAVVAGTTGGGGGGAHTICYNRSVVRTGHTYYDCQSCDKVYDEKGKGSQSKCWD